MEKMTKIVMPLLNRSVLRHVLSVRKVSRSKLVLSIDTYADFWRKSR